MSLRLPERRNRWALARDGLFETTKDEDATERYEVDFRAKLQAGEMLTGSTWVRETGSLGVTEESLEGNRSTLLITGSGSVKGTLTTNTGRTLIRRLRFLPVEQ